MFEFMRELNIQWVDFLLPLSIGGKHCMNFNFVFVFVLWITSLLINAYSI